MSRSSCNEVLYITSALTALAAIFILRRLLTTPSPKVTASPPFKITRPVHRLSQFLASTLPDSTILPTDISDFNKARKHHWDEQENERVPSCIVRPRNVKELCTAIILLKRAYKDGMSDLFAVRSGGHSPVSGAASINGGFVIDMNLFNEVNLSSDHTSVNIGPGCRWTNVTTLLDSKGLAVVGGRNSDVGVGGLLLSGGISFYSPRFGLACNNIISYEVVLADGSVVTASSSSHPDLWRALKGGSNNFGIVTRFTVPCFSSTKVWSGFLYLPSFQTTKVLKAIHDSVARNPYDENVAGPLACFTYAAKLGFPIISVNIVHTRPTLGSRKWPKCLEDSSLKSMFRFWSTCKERTLTDATDELHSLDTKNGRQVYGTTTIKNDPATIAEAYATYSESIAAIRRVKGIHWTLVLQPLLPVWLRKGDPNPMNLHAGPDTPLVLVSYTVSWARRDDDELVEGRVRECLERIDEFAEKHGTGHPYRFQNYCGEWQKPFEGYGEKGLQFLGQTSRAYDPDGLFQKGCVGGFKLDMEETIY
ncbi:FAD-binding domain-containing protein [Byssothecium circinans]|uniref:FAD-binding domain-containing protein n=1 Tax=Byssothecium circinans TaxID=147558 RepID=A0A6A5UBE6_9PLEO|nr:FAD-binding domain-containing protein [Byssothecium circinans]